jgi:hypothetical protein
MFAALHVVTIVLVAFAMALGLAHVLEWPGKMRLSKEHYLATQAIYYPGFTIGGAAEPLGLLLLLALVVFTPAGTPDFWLRVAAFIALLASHLVYWLMTHPVNNFWLKDVELKVMGSGFFGFDPLNRTDPSRPVDWTHLRDRWELSHAIRAGFGVLSFVLLVTAAAA